MGKLTLDSLRKKAEDNPEDIDAWLHLGRYAADRFVVSIAEKALKRVLEKRPNDPDTLLLLGKALNRRRMLSEAETVYQRVLTMDPDSVEANTGLAVVYGNAGRFEESIRYFRKAYELDKGYPWLIHSFTSSLEEMGQGDEAYTIARRGIEENPESALVWAVYAVRSMRKGLVNDSKHALEEAFKRIENDTPENQRRALMNIRPLDTARTIKVIEMLLKKDRDHVSLYQILGLVYLTSDPRRGLEAINEALAIDPTNPQLRGGKAALLLATGDIPGALKLKEEMESDTPEDIFSSVIGTAAAQESPWSQLSSEDGREKYLAEATRMVKRLPYDVMTHLNRVIALSLTDRTEEAEAALLEVDHLNFTNAEEHLRYAMQLDLAGLQEKADSHFIQAIELEKNPYRRYIKTCLFYNVRQNYGQLEQESYSHLEDKKVKAIASAVLARLMYADGESQSAAEYARVAAESGIHDSMVLLGSVLKKEGKAEEANVWLQKVVKDKKAKGTVKARAHLGLGQVEEAKTLLETTLGKSPGNFLALELLLSIAGRERDTKYATQIAEMILGINKRGHGFQSTSERKAVAQDIVGRAMSGESTTHLGSLLMTDLLEEIDARLSEEEE
ncbi:MAG: tetratricopeptide repeat protein [Candidatus Thorarchaeota archaeon]